MTSSEGSLVLENRFAIVPEWVIDADLSDAAFRLYAVLLRYGQSSGARMPSRAVLAARLKKRSTDTVDRALKELVAAGAVVVERRRRGRENLTNRYHVMSTPPGARSGSAGEGGRADAATAPGSGGGRRRAARGGRTDAATPAAGVRPDPEVLTQQQPPPASPAFAVAGVDVEGLAAECSAVRTGLGLASSRWTARAVGTALHQAVVEGGRPADVAVRALLRVAADPATRVPGRLVCDGPWWDAVAAAALTPSSQEEQAELAELEARLAEVDGRRVWVQRRARQELAARGESVTRLAVARLACRFLAEGRVEIA